MLIKPLKAAKKIEQEIVRAGGKTQVQSGEKHATSQMFGNSRSVRWKQPMIMAEKHATNANCGTIGNFL